MVIILAAMSLHLYGFPQFQFYGSGKVFFFSEMRHFNFSAQCCDSASDYVSEISRARATSGLLHCFITLSFITSVHSMVFHVLSYANRWWVWCIRHKKIVDIWPEVAKSIINYGNVKGILFYHKQQIHVQRCKPK